NLRSILIALEQILSGIGLGLRQTANPFRSQPNFQRIFGQQVFASFKYRRRINVLNDFSFGIANSHRISGSRCSPCMGLFLDNPLEAARSWANALDSNEQTLTSPMFCTL